MSAQAALSAAEQKCLRLLSVRERSSGELLKRLEEDGFDAGLAWSLVERLVDSGLVDDERFCRLYVQGKRRQGWGTRRIANQLRTYSIDINDYPALMAEHSPEDELAHALDILERYRGRAKDAYAGRYRYLASKGFAPDIISQTLRHWLAENRES